MDTSNTITNHAVVSVKLEPKLIDDDRLLMGKIATGDAQAFEILFKRYYSRVFRFSVRLLKEPQLAEEATCDTLFAVWDGASRFKGQSSVSTWIFGIAYRRSMKTFNKDSRHTSKVEPGVEPEELIEYDPGGNPETYTNNAMESSRMILAMETLSQDHRAVIELVALGHSCAEIAEIVQCPENTVKTRAFHARRKLRSSLGTD